MPKKVVIAKHPVKVAAHKAPAKKIEVKKAAAKVVAVKVVVPPDEPIVVQLHIVPAALAKSFTTRDVDKAGVRIR